MLIWIFFFCINPLAVEHVQKTTTIKQHNCNKIFLCEVDLKKMLCQAASNYGGDQSRSLGS